MHFLGNFTPIGRGIGFLNEPWSIFHQRRVDKRRPAIEHVDHFALQARKAPGLVSGNGQCFVACLECSIQINHAPNKSRFENADGTEIHQINGIIRPGGVIAQMRIAVNHAVTVKWYIPRLEQTDT